MSFEQKRNAERLPLNVALAATASGLTVTIVEMSAIGCKIEHREKLSIGGNTVLRFRWGTENVEVKAKVARMQLRSMTAAGMLYESGLKFADSLEEAPDVIRSIVAFLAKEELPPEIAPEIAPDINVGPPPPAAEEEEVEEEVVEEEVVEEEVVEEEVVEVEDEVVEDEVVEEEVEVEETIELAAEGGGPTSAEAGAPLEVEEDFEYEHIDEFEDIDPAALTPPEPEPPVEVRTYIECRLDEDGKWHRRTVNAPIQPEEGFITLPADDGELNMLCKTYAYADPDTRRLIRISLELTATAKRD